MSSVLLPTAPAPDAPIEIRDHTGDPGHTVDFVNAVWAAQFPDDFTCPQWDREYFAWRQFGQDRHVRIAAYLEDRMVGYVFGEGLPYLWRGEKVRGMFSTTLAVDPALKGKGVAKAVSKRLHEVIREQELAFMYGFAVPGEASLGPKFWSRQHGGVRTPGIRPFIRPLNSKVLAERAGPRSERLVARATGLAGLHRVRARGTDVLRPFAPSDLDACLELVRDAEAHADLRFDWTPDLLGHTLDFQNTPKTLVADRGRGAEGFVTWHRTWFEGRGRFASGVIDHCISPDPVLRRTLLHAALAQMQEQGIAIAACPTSASTPVPDLLRAGFLPMPQRYDFILLFNDPAYQSGDLRTLRVHLG